MPSDRDIERLVRQVTDLVLARVGNNAGDQDSAVRRQVQVLLPTPSENLPALLGHLSQLVKGGYPVTTLVTAQVRSWLEHVGAIASFPGHVQNAYEPWAESQMHESSARVLVLGSLGFSFYRRLEELNDEDPMVWMITRALLAKVPVLAVGDDLSSTSGASGSVAQKGLSILSDMDRMGVDVVTMDQMGQRVEALCATDATLSRSFGQLLGESDVQRLAASGQLKIALARGTLVTPLARSKALELGLELIEQN